MNNSLNWRIRFISPDDFFIEADIPNPVDGVYPTIEVLQDDVGDEYGYTFDMKLDDAKLIAMAPRMYSTINGLINHIQNSDLNIDDDILQILLDSISEPVDIINPVGYSTDELNLDF